MRLGFANDNCDLTNYKYEQQYTSSTATLSIYHLSQPMPRVSAANMTCHRSVTMLSFFDVWLTKEKVI